jgi:transposase
MDLTNEQWSVLEPLIGELPRRSDGRGRPWRSSRDVLNGILWILRTGAQWADLPERYPPYQTCHRRFQRWVREGTLEQILEALERDLKERGKLDLSESFMDMFHRWHLCGRQKRSECLGRERQIRWGKGSKRMARGTMADRSGLPLAACAIWAAAAAPRELTLVAPTLDSRFIAELPVRLIGDRADDADSLDVALDQLGIEMIAPHWRGRTRPKTQDGRPLRRYRRRWKIERLFAWLGNFRRLVVRYERYTLNYLGFVRLGCVLILLWQGL